MNVQKCKRLGEVLEESVAKGEIAGGNLCVMYQGKEVYYAEAGYADIAEKKKIDRDSLFRLYSMTKPVTCVAVMKLVEEGKLDLLDPVSKYIPEFANMTVASKNGDVKADRELTITDCLSMTTGLTYEGDANGAQRDVTALYTELEKRLYTDNPMTTVEFAKGLGHCRLAFQPGETFLYGTSADLLGAIVEIVSKMSFGEYLKKEIFEPLGMKDTAFSVPAEKRDRLTTVYEQTAEGLQPFHGNRLGICNHMDAKQITFESGGAGLVSTIEDYKKFTQMLMQKGSLNGKEILSPRTVTFMTTGKLLPQQQEGMAGWDNLKGFSYHYLMRVLQEPSLAVFNASKGEYGWDGWLGPYFSNMPQDDVTFLMMIQKTNAGTFTLTRKLRNVLAAALEN